jgi:hypothetical protein
MHIPLFDTAPVSVYDKPVDDERYEMWAMAADGRLATEDTAVVKLEAA